MGPCLRLAIAAGGLCPGRLPNCRRRWSGSGRSGVAEENSPPWRTGYWYGWSRRRRHTWTSAYPWHGEGEEKSAARRLAGAGVARQAPGRQIERWKAPYGADIGWHNVPRTNNTVIAHRRTAAN